MLSAMAAAKDSASLANRPSCVGGKRESIPIAENEEYKFDYDTERGVYKRILPMKIEAICSYTLLIYPIVFQHK
jgi:hypothetical protein